MYYFIQSASSCLKVTRGNTFSKSFKWKGVAIAHSYSVACCDGSFWLSTRHSLQSPERRLLMRGRLDLVCLCACLWEIVSIVLIVAERLSSEVGDSSWRQFIFVRTFWNLRVLFHYLITWEIIWVVWLGENNLMSLQKELPWSTGSGREEMH